MYTRCVTYLTLGVLMIGATLIQPAVGQPPYPARVVNPPYAPPINGSDGLSRTATMRSAPATDVIGYDAYPPRAASVRSLNPPTLMTSINYPSIYGDYYYAVGRFNLIAEPFSPDSPIYATSSYGATVRIPSALHNLPARIDVSVPRNADVWLNGTKSMEEGSFRTLLTPNLESGRIYNFAVIASWEEDGKRVTQRQRVMVRPGDHLTVAMIAPTPTPAPPTESMLKGYPAESLRR